MEDRRLRCNKKRAALNTSCPVSQAEGPWGSWHLKPTSKNYHWQRPSDQILCVIPWLLLGDIWTCSRYISWWLCAMFCVIRNCICKEHCGKNHFIATRQFSNLWIPIQNSAPGQICPVPLESCQTEFLATLAAWLWGWQCRSGPDWNVSITKG